MAPGIKRSIGEGFRAAVRSWPAMGVYAGGWALVFAVAVLGFVVTGVPQEAFQAPGASVEEPVTPAAEDTPAAAPAVPAAPQPNAQAAIADWVGRAWPVLLLIALVVLAASTWLYAGQIGYLAARVRGQSATVATYVSSASRAFVPLLLTSLLMLAAVAALALLVALLAAGLAALPQAPAAVLGALLLAAGLVALVWLMVRAAFWFIAVVADGRGPVAGLRASLAATKGTWWKTCGLLASLLGIAIVTVVAFNLLNGLGGVIGGPAGFALQAVVTLVQVVLLNLLFGFAFIAASIRFYEDAKAPA